MSNDFTIEMFYDGDCPLCMRETRFLQKLDRRHRIRFANIAAPDFDPESVGKTHADLMAEIHGRLPDGTWITGVEVFRRLYASVGLGPLVQLTRLPFIKQLMNAGYRLFARNRLKLTGRCDGRCALPASKQ
jgi:predicted DCC family thiol-disulfide oxidoreductase YuxK